MNNQSANLINGQTRSYAQAISTLFYEALKSKMPLDRRLRTYFREHKNCGSRDRRFISEALFSLFRWYGWLKKILPEDTPDGEVLENENFRRALAAALLIDANDQSPAARAIITLAGFSLDEMPCCGESLQEKMTWIEANWQLAELSIKDLVPAWFLAEASDDTDWPALIESFQSRPPVWLRLQGKDKKAAVNEMRDAKISFERHPQLANAVQITQARINLNELKAYRQGKVEVQDLASQALGFSCLAQKDEDWWDVCAGGGGKSLQLADHMHGMGRITSSDIRAWKLDDLKKRAAKANFKNIKTRPLDKIYKTNLKFDGVLIDAPCSCTGTWRRSPDVRWTSAADSCVEMAKVQKEIVDQAAKKVKGGGVLVYATCSLSRRENEEVVTYILDKFPLFELEGFTNPLNGKLTDGTLKVLPYSDNSDGMFAARFRKKLQS